MDEIWKDIQGYERLYQVSNLGRVKALPRTDSNNRQRKERIMKQFRDKDGYYILGLTVQAQEEKASVLICFAIKTDTYLPTFLKTELPSSTEFTD